MARNIVFTPKAGKPPPTYSQAVKAAGLVFVSGTAPPIRSPARQGAKLPVRVAGLKISIAVVAEA